MVPLYHSHSGEIFFKELKAVTLRVKPQLGEKINVWLSNL
jgi:hypothetical protein